MHFLRFLQLCINIAVLCSSVSGRSITQTVVGSTNFSGRTRFVDSSDVIEMYFKKTVKEAVKTFLPEGISIAYKTKISGNCLRSLLKMIRDLKKAKMWVIKMLDATSKLPPGLLEGTINDYGDFDECLSISLSFKNGSEDFRGQFCAIEGKPFMEPPPKNFSIVKLEHAAMTETLQKEIHSLWSAFLYLQVRAGVCVPSSCTENDMSALASEVASRLGVQIKVPRCYVKEHARLETIHLIMIFLIAVLIALAILGTVLELKTKEIEAKNLFSSGCRKYLLPFSVLTNMKSLVSSSKIVPELRCLLGFRTISFFWVMICQTLTSLNIQHLKSPWLALNWIKVLGFQVVLNSWLAADSFFFVSGLITCVLVFQAMTKSGGKLDISTFLLHRYIRTTPPILLVMSLLFFLPLLSSGPFWYEKVEPEIDRCENYWWTNLLYVGNWFGIEKICLEPTWYFSAEFQLHILSLLVILPLYRSSCGGLSALCIGILACVAGTGALIYYWNLPPSALLFSANKQKITESLDLLFIHTVPHVGSYCIGIATAYLILKFKELKLSKTLTTVCWLASASLSLSAVFGAYGWSMGENQSELSALLYGSLHRCVFALALAWVVFACATGNGGCVNKFLSLSVFDSLSKLTYLTYLFHTLVLLLRDGSRRERIFTSICNIVYEIIPNVLVSFLLAAVFHLLMEAPISNLERLFYPSYQSSIDDKTTSDTKKEIWKEKSQYSADVKKLTIELKSPKS